MQIDNMKRFLIMTALLAATLLSACTESSVPVQAGDILRNIKEPVFRDADYTIADYGAVADGTSDCRPAINNAIAECSDDGGGRVVVPPGKWFCRGAIVLKSNVNLYLSPGSEIVFSGNPRDYLPAVLTIFEGTELYNYSPLVYAYHVSNIAVTGEGLLNGNAATGFAAFRPQGSAQQDTLRQMGSDCVPVHERYFGERSILPPSFIQPFGCRNVLIEGVRIIDSPYWVIHPVFCDNVTVRGVSIESHNLNNDGCDPEYTTNVLIEDCTFDTGDDAIAIKAGRDADAWRIGQKTSGIVIRNCRFNSLCNGLCIGSEMSAGVENVFMSDVEVGKCHTAIYFKANRDRGGFIRNVYVNNIVCDTVLTAFIRFENNYHGYRGGNSPTVFGNFLISNVTGGCSLECGFYSVGIPGYEISDVRLENIDLKEVQIPYVLKNNAGLVFDNVRIGGQLMPQYPDETDMMRLRSN